MSDEQITPIMDPNPDLFVAMVLPHSDGSGSAIVLGVYTSRDAAEARCWRALQRYGYEVPTAVIERPLDMGNEDEGHEVEWGSNASADEAAS